MHFLQQLVEVNAADEAAHENQVLVSAAQVEKTRDLQSICILLRTSFRSSLFTGRSRSKAAAFSAFPKGTRNLSERVRNPHVTFGEFGSSDEHVHWLIREGL